VSALIQCGWWVFLDTHTNLGDIVFICSPMDLIEIKYILASNHSLLPDKELVAAKERQEIELAAQRATLQEQRTHIDILDTALTNAQGNVVRLEEEVSCIQFAILLQNKVKLFS
jgi:hypothetical protein